MGLCKSKIYITLNDIKELRDEIINHYQFMNDNEILLEKSNFRYSHLTRQLISQKHKIEFWNKTKNELLENQLSIKINNRKSPYQLSEELYNK